MVITIDINFDQYIALKYKERLAIEVSKYPLVYLDYTIILKDNKYQDLEYILNNFKNNLIMNYKLVDVYENKYTISYTLGSNERTLEQEELQLFKDNFLKYIKESGLEILE